MAKCRICKVDIKPSKDDFIKLNKLFYYHTDCYKIRELDNLVPSEVINDVIEKAKYDYKIEQEEKIKIHKNKSAQDGLDPLVKWIQQEYDISFLPKTFYMKMASVANGTYKGLKEPVTYEEVLDMLQRRKRKLDLQLASKKFDKNLYRFYYDLAVVLNQYDSYKAWKIEQENKKNDILNDLELQNRIIETQKVASKQVKSKDKDSIESMLDDIFD